MNYLRRSRARRRLRAAFLEEARLDTFFLLRFPFWAGIFWYSVLAEVGRTGGSEPPFFHAPGPEVHGIS
jgi:hypothetical protein